MLEAGAFAPDFRIPSLEGELRGLSDILSGGPALLAFYKGSCPVSQFTFPFLERLHKGRAAGAPQIIAISQDDPAQTREFDERYGVTFPSLLDRAADKYPAGNAFRITNVPSVFLIEPDGRISLAWSGFDKAGLEELGTRFGAAPFRDGEEIPTLRPG